MHLGESGRVSTAGPTGNNDREPRRCHQPVWPVGHSTQRVIKASLGTPWLRSVFYIFKMAEKKPYFMTQAIENSHFRV